MIPALFALLIGCPRGEQGGSECAAERPCGWGETCVNGYCTGGLCATSAQCPIESYCEDGACEAGCRADSDCGPGKVCDVAEAACVANACQDTQVDCGFAEYCDTTTGTCFDAGEQFCRPCEVDATCGEGNVCYANFCGVDCNDRECPSGFDCLPLYDGFGNIQTFQCITYCALFQDQL